MIFAIALLLLCGCGVIIPEIESEIDSNMEQTQAVFDLIDFSSEFDMKEERDFVILMDRLEWVKRGEEEKLFKDWANVLSKSEILMTDVVGFYNTVHRKYVIEPRIERIDKTDISELTEAQIEAIIHKYCVCG